MNNNIQNGFNGYNNYNNYEIPMNPAQMYQQNQIVRPMAPTVPTMPAQMPMAQQNPMMNGYNQFNQFGYNIYGMPQTTPMPTVPAVMNPTPIATTPVVPAMNPTVPGQMPVMPNQFNARTPMANTTPMATQQMMYQNPMARTNPMMQGYNMMGQQYTNPMNPIMAQQYGMAQQNPMMQGYNQYNQFGYNQYGMPINPMMNKPTVPGQMVNNFGYNQYGMPINPMMNKPTVPAQMSMVNNYGYNQYGMPINQQNPIANQFGMVNQILTHNGGINNPTLVSKQELIEKVEKDLFLKKECKDFTFIVTRTSGIYIFFKRRNKKWIKKFSGTLWNGCHIKIICEGDVVYIPLAVNPCEKPISNDELLIFLENLRPNFFLKKLVRSDFIKINDQIFCTNSDNLLEKYEKYEPSYFFISPEKNKLVQDFCNALTNDEYLFIDEKTQTRYSLESLTRLKALEDHFEEVKDHEE